MMDHPTLPVVIGLIVVLFAAWLITGGPNRDPGGKFIKPAAPVDTGEVYDEQLLRPGTPIEELWNI